MSKCQNKGKVYFALFPKLQTEFVIEKGKNKSEMIKFKKISRTIAEEHINCELVPDTIALHGALIKYADEIVAVVDQTGSDASQ